MNNPYITSSEVLQDKDRQILENSPTVIVSGRPIRHGTPDGTQTFFADCEPVVDVPIMVSSAIANNIPEFSNRHLDPIYHGQYPVIIGYGEDGSFYNFAILDALNFAMRPDDRVIRDYR